MGDFNGLQIQYYARERVYGLLCSLVSPETDERVTNTARMVSDAMFRVKDRLNKDFEINVCCNDYYSDFYTQTVLGYCKTKEQDNVILIPDFNFMERPSSGVMGYDETVTEICRASKKEPENNTLFWIGNPDSHASRRKLIELSETDRRIEAYGMGWGDKDQGVNAATKFVSLPNHTKYKYLIDLPGYGWSGRMKFLMFSGRPLFLAEHEYYEYWHEDLIPFENYIPVKGDLSDLSARIDWAEAHPKECAEIAKNAQEYALDHLMYTHAIDYLGDVLIRLSLETL